MPWFHLAVWLGTQLVRSRRKARSHRGRGSGPFFVLRRLLDHSEVGLPAGDADALGVEQSL
jgi:hypothetical protein